MVGFFGTNLYSAQGAGQGVAAAHEKGKVYVAGYDAEPAEITLLRQGIINILVIQNPAAEGSLAVQDAYWALTGQKSMIKKSVLLPNFYSSSLKG
jgi:ribose transport system substrate-binding protein